MFLVHVLSLEILLKNVLLVMHPQAIVVPPKNNHIKNNKANKDIHH
jgi:hypothetical protein